MSQKPRRRTESTPPATPPAEVVRLRVTREEHAGESGIDDRGLPLDELGAAFAEMFDRGSDPYQSEPEPEPMGEVPAVARPEPVDAETGLPESDDEACAVSPRTILEAMLFIGHPTNEPLSSQQVAGLMRGVRPEEIDELVIELNDEYLADEAPYYIESVGAGYRLALHGQYASLHEQFLGKVREAKLSQFAIDTLAIVAYQQPITRSEVDRLRGKPSGALLSQLVRRDLLKAERTDTKPRELRYTTTERFLQLFGLSSLDDLPRSQDQVG
jgi:segregation and condensation protein B